MSLSPFKQDIDELIDEFVEGESTTLADMKIVWLSRKFTYIFDAMPSTKLALFMQSLYAHTIGELKKLKNLVVDAKDQGIKVVPTLVNRMLEKNMFLFGSVDLNEGSVSEMVNQLTELQNARVQHAYEKLFADTRIEQFLHMDLGMEFDINALKKMSTKYAEAKKQAIQEASKEVDIQNIQHIADDEEVIGDVVESIIENWNVQREIFSQQTGSDAQEQESQHQKREEQNRDDDIEEFGRELEMQLFDEEPQQKQKDEEFSHELELQLHGDEQQEHREQDDEFNHEDKCN